MKKVIICIGLAICLILLTSCSAVKEAIPFVNEEPLYEISELKSAERYYLFTALHDNLLAIYGTDNSEEQKDFIVLYNIDRGKVIADSEIDIGAEDIQSIDFSEEVTSDGEPTLKLYDGGEETNHYFDISTLSEVSIEVNQRPDYETKAAEAEIDSYDFSLYENHAQSYSYDSQAFLFYDDPETIYLVKNNDTDYFDINCAGDNKLVMTQSYNQNNSLTFRILDFNTQCLTDEYTTYPFNRYFNITPTGYSLSAKTSTAAFIVTAGTDTNYFSTPYIWNFSDEKTENEFSCEVLNNAEIETAVSDLAEKIGNKYDLNVITDNTGLFEAYGVDTEAEDYDEEEAYLVDTPKNFRLYCDLTELETYLADFPKGMFTEICTNSEEEGIDIYFVKSIHDDIGTAAFQSYLENDIIIVFSTDNWCRENVYHEFMHAIENGITYEENGKSFDELWLELNPEDFEYHYGDSENADFIEDYFISMYAETNTLEDRAVTFESMCSSGVSDYEPYWKESNKEHIIEKADLLCIALRESYTTVANSDKVIWENYAD